FALADLAAGGEGECRYPEEAAGDLEAGDASLAESGERRGLGCIGNADGGGDDLAIVGIGQAEDGDGVDRRMRAKQILDLSRINVLAAADDHVAQPSARDDKT